MGNFVLMAVLFISTHLLAQPDPDWQKNCELGGFVNPAEIPSEAKGFRYDHCRTPTDVSFRMGDKKVKMNCTGPYDKKDKYIGNIQKSVNKGQIMCEPFLYSFWAHDKEAAQNPKAKTVNAVGSCFHIDAIREHSPVSLMLEQSNKWCELKRQALYQGRGWSEAEGDNKMAQIILSTKENQDRFQKLVKEYLKQCSHITKENNKLTNFFEERAENCAGGLKRIGKMVAAYCRQKECMNLNSAQKKYCANGFQSKINMWISRINQLRPNQAGEPTAQGAQ